MIWRYYFIASVAVSIPMICSVDPASACDNMYYEITFDPVSATQKRIDNVMDEFGSAQALADEEERLLKEETGDRDIPAADKAKLIGFRNANIRAANCWAASGYKASGRSAQNNENNSIKSNSQGNSSTSAKNKANEAGMRVLQYLKDGTALSPKHDWSGMVSLGQSCLNDVRDEGLSQSDTDNLSRYCQTIISNGEKGLAARREFEALRSKMLQYSSEAGTFSSRRDWPGLIGVGRRCLDDLKDDGLEPSKFNDMAKYCNNYVAEGEKMLAGK